MKLSAPYKCDYCTNTKGEANHWWMRRTEALEPGGSQPWGFWLVPWGVDAGLENPKGEPLYEHICSEQCAVKALAKFMATTPRRPGDQYRDEAYGIMGGN
jgi:hypothetical protein